MSINHTKNSNTTKFRKLISIRDLTAYMKDNFKMLKKNMLISSIGLIIASLIISQTFIVLDSYQQYTYNDLLTGNDTTSIKIIMDNVNDNGLDTWRQYYYQNDNNWVENYNLDFKSSTTYVKITSRIALGERIEETLAKRWMDTVVFNTLSWNEETFNLLKQFPTFPLENFDSNTSLLIIPPIIEFPRGTLGNVVYHPEEDFLIHNGTGYEFEILVDFWEKTGLEALNLDIKFLNTTYYTDLYWQMSREDLMFKEDNNILILDEMLAGAFYLPELETLSLRSYLFQVEENFEKPRSLWCKFQYESQIHTSVPNYEDIKPNRLKEIIDAIIDSMTLGVFDTVKNEIGQENRQEELFIGITSPLGIIVDLYLDYVFQLKFLLLISSIPLIYIAFMLIYFSNIITNKKRRNIKDKNDYKGAPEIYYKLNIFIEILIISIWSSFIGFWLSIKSSNIFLSEVPFIGFSVDTIPVKIPNWLIWKLPIICLLLLLQIAILNDRNLLNSKNMKKLSNNVFGRINIGSLVVIVIIIYWIFILNIKIISYKDLIYKEIGLILIIALILYLPFSYSNEIFFNILRIISRFFNNKLVLLSFHNLRNNKKFTKHLLTIIFSAFLFTNTILIYYTSVINYEEEINLYNLGTEIFIDGVEPSRSDVISQIQIPGIDSYSIITYYRVTTRDYNPSSSDNDLSYTIMGIDPKTFTASAYWRDDFSSYTLNQLSDAISDNVSIALHEDILDFYNIKVGDEFNMRYSIEGGLSTNISVSGSYKYFPRLLLNLPKENEVGNLYFDEITLLMSKQKAQRISEQLGAKNRYGIYVKVNDKDNIMEIKNKLIEIFSVDTTISVYSYQDNEINILSNENTDNENVFDESQHPYKNALNKYDTRLFLSSIISIVFLSLIIVLVALLYYSIIINLERNKEFGIYRSVGMIRNQIFSLINFEMMLILIISLSFSLILSVFISNILIFLTLLNKEILILPIKLLIPYKTILFNGLVIVAFMICSILPSIRRISKSTTNSILRMD
ncbi:MAG: ABC transporter permease [Candidatus Heimdallarchaeota archaeon]|nr:ABC transporter permease [Candidatus Heimdallarchaeota archaeon]